MRQGVKARLITGRESKHAQLLMAPEGNSMSPEQAAARDRGGLPLSP